MADRFDSPDGHRLTYEARASISAPGDAVWRILSDVAAWPEWLPTVDAVEPLDSRTLQLGSRFRVRQPKLRPATWVVTELGDARFVWCARSPALLMTAEHSVYRENATASRVLLTFSFAGLLGGIVGRVFRSTTQRYLAIEATSLKSKAENERQAR